jgi:hypothetical protein
LFTIRVARIGSRGFTYRVCFPSLPAPSFSPRKNAALGERPQGIDSGSEREQARQKEKEREREREKLQSKTNAADLARIHERLIDHR